VKLTKAILLNKLHLHAQKIAVDPALYLHYSTVGCYKSDIKYGFLLFQIKIYQISKMKLEKMSNISLC